MSDRSRRLARSVARSTTEVKLARSDRRYLCEDAARRQHQWRNRQFNRAQRRLGRALCRDLESGGF